MESALREAPSSKEWEDTQLIQAESFHCLHGLGAELSVSDSLPLLLGQYCYVQLNVPAVSLSGLCVCNLCVFAA